jgi:D-amino-acid dehydrogenase
VASDNRIGVPPLRFVVVGGGICGLFVSYYLLERGDDVTLVDTVRDHVRTSAYNAGQLSTRPSFTDIFAGHAVLRISPGERRRNRKWLSLARRQSLDAYEETGIPLSVRSVALYEKFFATEKAEVDLVRDGLDLHTVLPAESKAGPGERFVGPRELSELGYKGFEGGWLVEERSLHSGKLLDYLGSRVSEMGARSVKGEARLKGSGSRISSALVGGARLVADAYVVAGGSWSREVCAPLGYDPMVIPARGLALFYRTGGEQVVDIPAHYEVEGVTATQHDRDTLRMTSFFELMGFNARFGRLRHQWLFQTVTSHFSRPCRLELSEAGVGFRPSTPDQLPVVGRIPRCDNGYILSGATRKGMALAPALAQLLIASVLGSEDQYLRPLNPGRFEHRV